MVGEGGGVIRIFGGRGIGFGLCVVNDGGGGDKVLERKDVVDGGGRFRSNSIARDSFRIGVVDVVVCSSHLSKYYTR